MDNNKLSEKIKNIKWQPLVTRRETLLFKSMIDNCRKYYKVTGIPWRSRYIIRFSSGEVFHSLEELNKLDDIFLKKDIGLLYNFKQRLIFYVKALDKIANKIEKTGCSKLIKKKLIRLSEEYIKASLIAFNFLAPLPRADKCLSKRILNMLPHASDEEKQRWLGVLIYPIKENEHVKEERSFLRLVRAFKNKNKNFNNLLKKHLNKFSWIGTRGYFWEKVWTADDIISRLNNFIAQGKNPDEEIRHLNAIKKERILAAKKLLKELNIKKSSQLYKLIVLAREFAYLRTWRTDIIYRAGHKARSLFNEVAKRAGIKIEDIEYLTFEEFLKAAKTEKLPVFQDELKKRKEYSVTLMFNGRYFVLSGSEWKRVLKNIMQHPPKTKKIRGSIAWGGYAKGIVKVVLGNEDIKKVSNGDILVAVMTFPQFIPAMEKAAAFVTDEGGILCHAAIVAREMKKPCIIGTKIATKVLKDGDLVEVDAERGIIRKL